MKILSLRENNYDFEKIKYRDGEIMIIYAGEDTMFLINDDLFNLKKMGQIASKVLSEEFTKQHVVKPPETIEIEELSEEQLNSKKLKKAIYKPSLNPPEKTIRGNRVAKTVPLSKNADIGNECFLEKQAAANKRLKKHLMEQKKKARK